MFRFRLLCELVIVTSQLNWMEIQWYQRFLSVWTAWFPVDALYAVHPDRFRFAELSLIWHMMR